MRLLNLLFICVLIIVLLTSDEVNSRRIRPPRIKPPKPKPPPIPETTKPLPDQLWDKTKLTDCNSACTDSANINYCCKHFNYNKGGICYSQEAYCFNNI